MIDERYLLLLAQKAQGNTKSNHMLLSQLRKLPSHDVDELFHTLHEEVFSYIDCLSCGNCCKTTGPLLLTTDIKRIAKRLKMSEKKFFDTYVRTDEDNDYVFKGMPCPFLQSGNSCDIYDDRPNACREYPHTDRRKMYQILDITMKNYAICPAVYDIIEALKTYNL
jgi:Fe-S-cluster containining protein